MHEEDVRAAARREVIAASRSLTAELRPREFRGDRGTRPRGRVARGFSILGICAIMLGELKAENHARFDDRCQTTDTADGAALEFTRIVSKRTVVPRAAGRNEIEQTMSFLAFSVGRRDDG